MEFRELMDAFAEDVGMAEPIAYEDDGLCRLDFDDRTVGFRHVPEAGRMVIWTAICTRPPESGEGLLVQLLRANFMNQGMPDGALSLSDDDVIYAHCTLALPVYDKAEFYSLLQRFLSSVDEWREMIALAGRSAEILKDIRAEEPPQSVTDIRIDI